MARAARGLAALGLAALGLASLLAACSPSTPTSPAASPAPPASAPAPASVAPSVAPSGDPTRHADRALEALLPDVLNGVSLVRESQRGSDLSRQSDALDALLIDLGRTKADLTIASAYSAAGEVKAQVGAWQIRGAETARLMPEFIKAIQASSTTTLTVSEISLAGRTVTQIGAAGQLTQGPLYAFARDDLLLFVQTPDPVLAGEAMAAIH